MLKKRKTISIEDDQIMASFVVTSLCTNIPITDTLNIIKDYVNNDDQLIAMISTRKTAIPQERFFDLINLVSATTWYTFDSQFYQQTDSVAMRKETCILNHKRNLYTGS